MDDSSSGPQRACSTGTVDAQFDWTSTRPSAGVVEAVAAARGCAPTALGSLYEYVDPEALDTLIGPRSATKEGGPTIVSFPYEAFDVTVYSTGEVVVRPPDARL